MGQGSRSGPLFLPRPPRNPVTLLTRETDRQTEQESVKRREGEREGAKATLSSEITAISCPAVLFCLYFILSWGSEIQAAGEVASPRHSPPSPQLHEAKPEEPLPETIMVPGRGRQKGLTSHSQQSANSRTPLENFYGAYQTRRHYKTPFCFFPPSALISLFLGSPTHFPLILASEWLKRTSIT